MKLTCLFFTFLAISLLVVSILMDTTNGSQYNNLGLMLNQFELIMAGCFMILCAVIIWCSEKVCRLINHDDFESQCLTESAESNPGFIERKILDFGKKLNNYNVK